MLVLFRRRYLLEVDDLLATIYGADELRHGIGAAEEPVATVADGLGDRAAVELVPLTAAEAPAGTSDPGADPGRVCTGARLTASDPTTCELIRLS